MLEARSAEPVAPITSIEPAALPYREVTATGTYDPAHEWILSGRSQGGAAGNHVLTPLVLDDGTAVVVDRGWVPLDVAGVPVTRTGMVMGTAQYISPEQASGRAAVPASDIYSLGVVAYECLAGALPFPNENAVAMALAHVREAPRPLAGDVPPAVAALVMRMLAKDPAARFPDGDGGLAGAVDHDEDRPRACRPPPPPAPGLRVAPEPRPTAGPARDRRASDLRRWATPVLCDPVVRVRLDRRDRVRGTAGARPPPGIARASRPLTSPCPRSRQPTPQP